MNGSRGEATRPGILAPHSATVAPPRLEV